MKFISYNLLSSALRTAKSFPRCSSVDLEPHARLNDITVKLKAAIDANNEQPAIFGLQEVSLEWSIPLRTFFEAQDYEFIVSCYGSHFNGYMGVALAYPKNILVCSSSIVITCPPQLGYNAFKKWKNMKRASDSKWHKKVGAFLVDSMPFQPYVKKLFAPKQSRPLPTMISDRYNRAIFITVPYTFGDGDHNLAVCTYHMPCIFMHPPVMAVHVLLLFKSLALYCKEQELEHYAVLMDGNFQPGSLPYRALTEPFALTDEEMMEISLVSPGILQDNTLGEFLWRDGNQAPRHVFPTDSITNYTVAFTGNEFCGKIDYIWFSNAIKMQPCTELSQLQDKDAQVTGYMPNVEQPSDHYMLAATLE